VETGIRRTELRGARSRRHSGQRLAPVLDRIAVGNTAEEFRKIILSDFEVFGRVLANAK
jgi:hypothetical protein